MMGEMDSLDEETEALDAWGRGVDRAETVPAKQAGFGVGGGGMGSQPATKKAAKAKKGKKRK